jgi:hypothetical protein
MGWQRLYPLPGYLAVPVSQDTELLIPAGQRIQLDITHIIGVYELSAQGHEALQGQYVVQLRYEPNSIADYDEMVQYSNEFSVGQSDAIRSLMLSSAYMLTRSIP